MKYYKAIMQMGHCGRGKHQDVPIYIYAKCMTEAMKYAQNMPAIKKDKMPISLVEISKEEYEEGRAKDEYKNTIISKLGKENNEKSNDLHGRSV